MSGGVNLLVRFLMRIFRARPPVASFRF